MSGQYMDEELRNELRIQDIVAKTARVNLRETVRVLRAAAIVLQMVGERDAAARLNHLLYQGATYDGFPAPLHSKPDAIAIAACDYAYDIIVDHFGDDVLDALSNLTRDPYYESKVNAGRIADGE